MAEEQSDEKSYDELYAKGFNEQDTTIESAEVEETAEIEEATETEEQPEETETEQPEETPDEGEETETTEEVNEDSNEPEKYSITIGGQEVDLSLDEMKLFAQKGGDYTRKTQDLAKNRADIELMTDKNLSHEDLVMLADALSGNKEALALIANKSGIDPLDVEQETSYKPEVANTNFELQDVVSEIKNDKDNSEVIDNWISVLPKSVKNSFADNPAILKGLHVDTKNGISKEIMPEVIKQLLINPNADFVVTYNAVGNNIVESKAKADDKSNPEATRDSKKRATVSKPKKTAIKDHQDVWDDESGEYEKLKKQLAAMR